VELFQEERKLLNFGRAIPRGKKIVDGIWVKVEIVGRLPQIPIVIWKVNWVSKLKKENLIWVSLVWKKNYSLVWKESLFMSKKYCFPCSK